MISSNLLVHSLLLGAAAALSQGWKNGPTATGPTDPNLTVDCDYFANNVQPGDTCTMVEDYFGITEEQFQNWVIFFHLFPLSNMVHGSDCDQSRTQN